nr:zinc-finger domain-containing protein [Conchiformibius kuhniae]
MPQATVITPHDLPLHCTDRRNNLGTYPRVFLPIESNSEYTCPYCGIVYRLDGEAGNTTTKRHAHDRYPD